MQHNANQDWAHTHDERRREVRTSTDLPCKILDVASGRYLPATLRDASTSGAYVEVTWSNTIEAGSELLLFLSYDGRPVVSNSDAIPASVRRILRTQRATTLGLALTGNLLFPLPSPARRRNAA